MLLKAHNIASVTSDLDKRSVISDMTPVHHICEIPTLRWMLYPSGTASVLWLRRKPHGELPL